ncbi:MAG: acyl-CoA dehydrogenase [Mariprofundaceae bacterium]|nr:acyl-CoA dehydrogenase [Mariprofundaceae bacterium]
MQWFILFGVFFLCLFALVRLQLSLPTWTGIITALLLLMPLLGMIDLSVDLFLWMLFALVFIPLYHRELRTTWLTEPVFRYMQQSLPPISESEKAAMASGTVGWDAELFSGHPDWKKLLNIPKNTLSDEEEHFLNHDVETLCSMLDDWDITHKRNDLSPETWGFIKSHGFFGMIIPKEYGGLAFSTYAHSQVVQKIASRSLTAAVTVMVPNSLGPAELLLSYGTDTQKTDYLPKLASGEEIPCFALTSSVAGSDAGAMTDKGVVCRANYQGQEVLGFRVHWEKRYITLGPVATVLGLAFHAYDPDALLGGKEDLGISCALIPTSTKGVKIGRRHYPLNAAFMNGPNSGSDVFVPMDWLIGGQAYIGQGWRMLVERLAVGRGISLPALSVGAGKRVSQVTGAYARVRKQFHLPIGRFEGVQEAMARIAGQTYMMDCARLLTLSMLDRGERPAVTTAIVKYYLTEGMRQIVNDGMDVHGGRGICMGPSNYLARMYQTIPVGITVEGANILTRSLIVFGQGAMRCHPFIEQEMAALKNNHVDQFDHLMLQHAAHFVRNAARSFLFSITNGHLATSPINGEMAKYYQQLARFSASFAVISDISLMFLGGKLKRKEMLSGRFSDALAYMYLCSAVLKRFEDDGCPEMDKVSVHWACQYALYQVQEALHGIIRHFPVLLVRWKLYIWVFPLGRTLRQPSDALIQKLALQLQQPGDGRKKWLDGIYLPDDVNDLTGRLEHALQLTLQVEPIERRLRDLGLCFSQDNAQALCEQGVLNNDEVTLLIQAEQAVCKAIAVDDFARGRKRST